MKVSEDLEKTPVKEGPPEGIPGDTPLDEVRNKFENILDDSTGEGRLGLRVLDENGDEKENVQYVRVEGKGSIEARKFEEQGEEKYGVRRRDRLDHNKNDKLGNNGGES